MAKQTRIVFRTADGKGIAKYVGPKESAVDARHTARAIMSEASIDERGMEAVSGVTYYARGKRYHRNAGIGIVSIDGKKYTTGDHWTHDLPPLGYTG